MIQKENESQEYKLLWFKLVSDEVTKWGAFLFTESNKRNKKREKLKN